MPKTNRLLLDDMIDSQYSKDLREQVDREGIVHASLLTPEEVDWLLEGDMNAGDGLEQVLVEEMFHRVTGLRVDLSVQGPAAFAVLQAGTAEDQEHNTFTYQVEQANQRLFKSKDLDSGTVPTRTAEDVNRACISLPYPAQRPKGTALDGMRITPHDNPVESAMVNQVTILQVLDHWGVDVEDLCKFVDTIWGIDYTRELVEKVGFARAADLEEYLAAGGRPAPTTYFSPNVSGLLRKVGGPSYDPDMVGYSHWFPGRLKELVKFHLMSSNFLRGSGAITALSMHPNAKQMSTFRPDSLATYKLTLAGSATPTSLRNTVTGKESYNSFIGCRQAAKQALVRKEVAIAEEMKAVMDVVAGSGADRLYGPDVFANLKDDGSPLAVNDVKHGKSTIHTLMSAPSKSISILFSIFHGTDDEKTLGNVSTLCNETLAISCLYAHIESLAQLWCNLERLPGFGPALKSYNILDACKVTDIDILIHGNPNAGQRELASKYMVMRLITSTGPSVRAAIEDAARMATQKSISIARLAGRTYRLGRHFRLAKLVTDLLGYVNKTRPFSYLASAVRNHHQGFRARSVLVADARGLQNVLDLQKDWDSFTSDKKVGGDKVAHNRVRPLFARVRHDWEIFYSKKYNHIMGSLFLLTKISGGGLNTLDPPDWDKTDDYETLLTYGLAIEAICTIASAAAFRFAKVQAPFIDPRCEEKGEPIDMLKRTVEDYTAAVRGSKPGELKVVVDLKMGQFGRESYLVKYLKEKVKPFLRAAGLPVDEDNIAKCLGVITPAYGASKWKVELAINECIAADREYLRAADALVEADVLVVAQDLQPNGGQEEEKKEPAQETTFKFDLSQIPLTPGEYIDRRPTCTGRTRDVRDYICLAQLVASGAEECADFAENLSIIEKNMDDVHYRDNKAAYDDLSMCCQTIQFCEPEDVLHTADGRVISGARVLAQSLTGPSAAANVMK